MLGLQISDVNKRDLWLFAAGHLTNILHVDFTGTGEIYQSVHIFHEASLSSRNELNRHSV